MQQIQLPQINQQQQINGQYQQNPQYQQNFGGGQVMYGQFNRGNRNRQDDCDCCEGDCCGDCKGCCECQECGFDGLSELNLNIFRGCQCCQCFACCSSGDILTELKFNEHNDQIDEDESEELLNNFQKYIVLYKIKKKIIHRHFGECMVLVLKKKEQEQDGYPKALIMKNIWLNQLIEYQRQVRFWSSIVTQFKCPYVIKLYALYCQKISDICTDRYRITLLIQKGHQVLEKRKSPGLIKISLSQLGLQLGMALKYLHDHSGEFYKEQTFYHTNRVYQINPTQYSIIPPYLNFVDGESNQLKDQIINNKLEGYLPQEFILANQEQQVDFDKVDIWILGLGLQEIIFRLTNQQLSQCQSDSNPKTLDQNKLQLFLEKNLRQKIPIEQFEIINRMLESDPQTRIDTQNLINLLKQIENQNVKDFDQNYKQQNQDNKLLYSNQMINPPIISAQNAQNTQVVYNSLNLNSGGNQVVGIIQVDQEIQLNGGFYTGQKLNNKKHGYGRLVQKDGSGYEGNWVNDRYNGQGTIYQNGGIIEYDGNFKDGKFHGFGHLHNINKKPYGGSWNYYDLRNIDSFWSRYDGDFIDDQKNGYGILYLVNDEKWAGEFKNNLPNGAGTFYLNTENRSQNLKQIEKITGKWKNGEYLQI